MARSRKPKDLRSKEEKLLGTDTYLEILGMDTPELNKLIAESTQSIAETKAELEANKDYIQVKYDKGILESGLREVKARQNAKIKVALQAKETRGN